MRNITKHIHCFHKTFPKTHLPSKPAVVTIDDDENVSKVKDDEIERVVGIK
jgi:hypothetical protein